MQKFLSKSVEYKDGKIYRHVSDIAACSHIIKILKTLNLSDNDVVSTRIAGDNLLEHEVLLPVLYSGEYTVSMAYDVTEKALELALKLIDKKIYSWDTLPHNFTYHHGKWILHDFDALDIKPDNVKTFVRNMFKISFTTFELIMRGISRADLKHFFLNRTAAGDVPRILPLHRACIFLIVYRFCMLLADMRFCKPVYLILNKLFLTYKNKHIRRYYAANNNVEEFGIINKIIPKSGRIFGLGKYYADWAFYNTNKNTDKFVYFEDYELCDQFYNSIRGKHPNIYTAVLSPCVSDVAEDVHYRALYDDYNKLRFTSDCVVTEFEEIVNNRNCLRNLFDFININGEIIIVFSRILYKKYIDKLSIIKEYFKKVEIYETEYKIILHASGKYELFPHTDADYGNKNRMRDAKLHGEGIKRIVREKMTNKK